MALTKGARYHGFAADLWTLPRVATVVERVTGVKYHPGHMWKILGSILEEDPGALADSVFFISGHRTCFQYWTLASSRPLA